MIADDSVGLAMRTVTHKDGVREVGIEVCAHVVPVCGHLQRQFGPVPGLREIPQVLVTLFNNQTVNVYEHFQLNSTFSADRI